MIHKINLSFKDHLYKLSGNKGKGFWSKSNPWKQKYFILRRIGDRPVLEYYSKKPKTKNSTPKGADLLFANIFIIDARESTRMQFVF